MTTLNTLTVGSVNTDTTNGVGAGHASNSGSPGSVIPVVDIALIGNSSSTNGNILQIKSPTNIAQNTVVTIPDPGSATATLILNTSAGYALAAGHTTEPSAASTASTTHTQAGGTAVTTDLVALTVNNSSDAVTLPASVAGMVITIANLSGTHAAQVYATGSDTINGTAGATGVSLATSAVTIYYCFVQGSWLTK